MTGIGKLFILIGAILLVLGVVLWGLGRLGFRGLPGDIHYESEHIRVYVPLATCLTLSAILSLLLILWRWLSRH